MRRYLLFVLQATILIAANLLLCLTVLVEAEDASSYSSSSKTKPNKRPHILFIVADDLGYNDVGFHQQQVPSLTNPQGLPTTNAAAGYMPTPTIDQLAHQGVKLENYYVQPLCSPTRASIMTGRYPSHTGIGPDVDRIDWPFGVPARETFVSERLKQELGYHNHMVGKWHLGACHERYHPTFRGFDSYVGYLAGGQGYYSQQHDRNSTCANQLGACLGPDFAYNYSSVFFANEAIRIVQNHNNKHIDQQSITSESEPLFLYLAFQSVHNPYDVPPMNVNATFPEIVDPTRRIYAGMVKMMDDAVRRVVQAFQDNGLWDDTVLVFTSDNGGIGPGSNYPLRGTKVFNWEGGIKAAGFVRGTNNPNLAPLPQGTTCNALMHATDWFLTLVEGVAGGNQDTTATLPLDGYNQWEVLKGRATTNRTTIFHNVPVKAKPIPTGKVDKHGTPQYTTSLCMHYVDNRTLPCHPFGITGGAMRQDNFKLLITSNDPNASSWGDTTPRNMKQIPPGGFYPNGSRVFVPTTPDIVPEPYQGQYYLFDIEKDPTESHNLAESMPIKLAAMLKTYHDYAATAVPGLSWRWGFTDPQHEHNPGTSGTITSSSSSSSSDRFLQSSTIKTEDVKEETCMGPFVGSEYCAYGHEWECYVMGNDLIGHDISTIQKKDITTIECQAACATNPKCLYWVLNKDLCQLKSAQGALSSCDTCVFGPKHCPS